MKKVLKELLISLLIAVCLMIMLPVLACIGIVLQFLFIIAVPLFLLAALCSPRFRRFLNEKDSYSSAVVSLLYL